MTDSTEQNTGRPSSFTLDTADLICSLLAEGKSLVKVCKLEGMPRYSTVMYWLRRGEKDEEPYATFLKNYVQAREDQAEYLATEIIDIADDDSEDFAFPVTEDGTSAKMVIKPDNIQRDRLRVDARKWVASKLLPKKYGEKLELAGSVNVTNQPLPEDDKALLDDYTQPPVKPRGKKAK